MASPSEPLVLAVLFGGRSPEHDISLRSARAVVDRMAGARFDLRLVGITADGGWLSPGASARLLAGEEPGETGGAPYLPAGVDCVFPVLHGPGGEDGSVQGWLELLGVPFVGSGCAGAALSMDKSLTKHVLRSHGIQVVPFTDVVRGDWQADPAGQAARIAAERGFPCFVKPTGQGSSIGISRVTDADALPAALDEAFRHGERAIVEPALQAREYEVAVLGGTPPQVSAPGAIVPRGWYDYEAKYVNDDAALVVPADDLPPRMAERLRDDAREVFRALRMEGMARVDFLLDTKSGRIALNEVNGIPGFTSISMYPKLMEQAGQSFPDLIARLVDDAMRRAGRSEHLLETEDAAAGFSELAGL